MKNFRYYLEMAQNYFYTENLIHAASAFLTDGHYTLDPVSKKFWNKEGWENFKKHVIEIKKLYGKKHESLLTILQMEIPRHPDEWRRLSENQRQEIYKLLAAIDRNEVGDL